MDIQDDKRRKRAQRRAVTVRLRNYFQRLTEQLATDADKLFARVLERLKNTRD